MNIRLLLSEIVRDVLEAIEPHLPRPRVIWDRAGESPYLSRYYLFGGPRSKNGPVFDDKGSPLESTIWRDLPVNLYLHKFHRGDDDLAAHSHPWRWALSFVLVGGYSEERRVPANSRPWKMEWRLVRPLSFNFIKSDDFHRVELIEKDCWSLFLAGPKADTWYFWDRDTGETIPWREFIFKRRGGAFEET